MNFRQHKEKLLKNLKVRTEYEKLGPEFQLARSLIRARLKKGWTQAELARRVGTSVRYHSKGLIPPFIPQPS